MNHVNIANLKLRDSGHYILWSTGKTGQWPHECPLGAGKRE